MGSIEYSNEAVGDIENIFITILNDRPKTASKYIDKLEEFISLIAYSPKLGVECKKHFINHKCRIAIFDDYKIFYQVNFDNIYILRVIHSKQQFNNTNLKT